ncbi:CRISPR-associated protein Cas4 [Thermoanaerobacterium thermosaccharolyticum]|uniref:CRISPR-associated exonuclease Cas4 n=1 Tax=Thermoanaerobacterium thermosaccharolyticum TaxID=1517 RepID=A0A223I0V3_THETR|nr:CRISPR-associated protein Cas4 [Thermoanaerobacterium thermosaccharolyticum]AST58135.1 CRISPR-associated protein Cas4 [Thermoanaerobacterium thermosaccharolyticum]
MIILNVIFTILIFYIIAKEILEKRPPYKEMKRTIGFKRGKLIYIDKQEEVKKDGIVYSKLLKSDKYGISGKPDYIYDIGNEVIPLELKSSKVDGHSPLLKDVMQLTAYFLIIEEEFGKKVRRGRIVYQNTMFEVYNTAGLRRELLKIIKEMRLLEAEKFFPDEKGDFLKCRFCPCRDTVCEIYKGSKVKI